MIRFCQNLLTASIHGSVVILAVMLLRLLLKKTPRKYICFLWMLAGIRLLMPISVQSAFSLQPTSIRLPAISSQLVWIVWGCVAALIVAGSLLAYLRLQKQVKGAVKVRGGYESDQIETAFVLGFFKPKIYIPSGMSPAARTQILAHERTHLEKGDHWIKVIAFLALALHWFNPLVWVAYLMLCKDIEIACDERVVQFMELDERKQYASALLQCSTNRIYYAACPVAFGEVSVKYRIKSALSYRKPAVWMSLMGVLSIAFVSLCLLTNPAQAVSDPQAALQQSSHQAPENLSFTDAPALEPNPDWGITLYMDATSPTGGYFACVVEERFILSSESMTIGNSHLERWNGTSWEPVEGPDPYYNVVKTRIGFAQSRNYSIGDYGDDIDWALNYGALPAGDYRIVMTISSDTESATFQTGFRIYREKLPDAEEDALTRCTNALNALSSQGRYSIFLSEESPAGNIQPVCQIQYDRSNSTVTYFYGEFQVSSGKMDEYDTRLSWAKDYQLNQTGNSCSRRANPKSARRKSASAPHGRIATATSIMEPTPSASSPTEISFPLTGLTKPLQKTALSPIAATSGWIPRRFPSLSPASMCRRIASLPSSAPPGASSSGWMTICSGAGAARCGSPPTSPVSPRLPPTAAIGLKNGRLTAGCGWATKGRKAAGARKPSLLWVEPPLSMWIGRMPMARWMPGFTGWASASIRVRNPSSSMQSSPFPFRAASMARAARKRWLGWMQPLKR